MAVDPALVGFDAVNTLQDTLLNYVMANRRMEQQNRQFNTQMRLQRDQFEEGQRRYGIDFDENQRRYGINTGFKERDESRLIEDRADYKLREKAGADTFRAIADVEKSKRERSKYDRDWNEFYNKHKLQDSGLLDLIPGGRKKEKENLKLAFEQGSEQDPQWMSSLLREPIDSQFKSYGTRPEVQIPEMQPYPFVPQYAPELLQTQRSLNPETLFSLRNEQLVRNILNK